MRRDRKVRNRRVRAGIPTERTGSATLIAPPVAAPAGQTHGPGKPRHASFEHCLVSLAVSPHVGLRWLSAGALHAEGSFSAVAGVCHRRRRCHCERGQAESWKRRSWTHPPPCCPRAHPPLAPRRPAWLSRRTRRHIRKRCHPRYRHRRPLGPRPWTTLPKLGVHVRRPPRRWRLQRPRRRLSRCCATRRWRWNPVWTMLPRQLLSETFPGLGLV
mmetsp:Transcript_18767/g.51583  ORF Transcript_18767/g.51583 Transcript_18767/m.51583 type:complete len:215 (+) Transcript_18767:996-1640(+)